MSTLLESRSARSAARPGRHPRLRRRGCRPGPPGGPLRVQPGLARRALARPRPAARDRGGRPGRRRRLRPRRAGPLSDFDLVLLHPSARSRRRSSPRSPTGSGTRSGTRPAARPLRPHRHRVPPGRGRGPHGRRRPARPRAARRRRASSSPRRAPPSPTTGAATPAAAARSSSRPSRAPPAPRRARAVPRARPQGGPRRAARHDRALRRWPRPGSPTARTAGSTPRTRLLLDVRDALHVVTGRGRDRLGREDQDAVAALLGLADADDLLTAVSSAGRHIAYALDGTLRRAGQSQRARTLRVGPRRPQLTPLGHGLFASDGEVVLGSTPPGRADAGLPLRAGVAAARAGAAASPPPTLDNLAKHAPTLSEPWPGPLRDLFGDLLAPAPAWSRSGRRSTRPGIVDTWLPGVGGRPDAPAAQRRPPVHRRPAPRRDRRARGRPGAPGRPARPAAGRRAAARHRQGRGAHDHSVAGAELPAASSPGWASRRATSRSGRRWCASTCSSSSSPPAATPTTPRTVDAAVAAVGGDREVLELLRALTEADAGRRAGGLDRLAGHPGRPARGRRARPPRRADPRRCRTDGADRGRPRRAARRRGARRGARPVSRTCGSSPPAARTGSTSPTRPGRPARRHGGPARGRGATVRSAILRTVDGIAVNEWHVESPSGAVPDPARLERGLAPARPRRPRPARDPRPAPGPRARGRPGAGVDRHARAGPRPRRARARAATRRCSRCGPTTGPACCTSSARRSRGPASRCARPTSRPTPGRRSTRSTSPAPTACRCRRPGSRRPSPGHRHLRRHLTAATPARADCHRRTGVRPRGDRPPRVGMARSERPRPAVSLDQCSPPSPTAWPTPSRTCAARAGSPRPTSTPRSARSASRCSRPTSRCPSSRSSSRAVRERALGAEVSEALNPAQQVVKIVNEELVAILGGETRRLRFAKKPPTVIMLAGLQGAGKTTLAGKLGPLAQGPGPHPAARRRRPAAPERRQPAPGRRRAGRRAGLRARARQRRRPRRRHRDR